MNTRKTEKVVNNHLFSKNILATAVATAMFGSTVALAGVDHSVNFSVTGDLTTSYSLHNTTTMTITGGSSIGSNLSSFNGTIDGNATNAGGEGNVVIAGNLTMRGNIGSTNTTGNFTLNAGNTLVLSDNVTTFNTANMSLTGNTVLNLGNATSGYNRISGNALTMQANITMASNSTINIGNGTTITGDVVGASSGQGTVNIIGNFTSGGHFGDLSASGASDLEQINISKGNTFTLSAGHNASATRMNINGTVTAQGSANITSAVTMGDGSVLNLTNTGTGGGSTAARVTGAIQSYTAGTAQGTLNVNGTWSTAGDIGQGGKGLTAINLDSDNDTASHTYTFAHNVNATTITLGTNDAQSTNTTLAISTAITVTGAITSSGNASAAGVLDINENAIFVGTVGASGASLAEITIVGDKIATFDSNIYSSNITLEGAAQATGGNSTLAFNGTANTAYTISGGIDGSANGNGLIDINTGNVTFSDVIGGTFDIAAINVADGAEMAISNNISANGTIVITGTLDINGNVTIHSEGLQIGSYAETGSMLETSSRVTLSSDTVAPATGGATHSFNNATIKLNGTHANHATNTNAYIDIGTNNQTLIMQGNTTIDLDLTNTVLTDGATVVIIGRGSAASSNGTLNISGNVSATAYQMFSIAINNSTIASSGYGSDATNASLNATVTYRTSSAMGFTGNTKTVYDSAKTAIAADTTVFQALAGMTTDTALKNAIATMHPATGGAAAASASISGSSMSTASTRMAYTRQVGLGKGMNAGSATLDESMWVQIFGADVDQDNVGGVSGYDADGQGLAIGIDGMSEDGTTRIGIAGSFANTDVSGKDSTTRTTTDIDTTQVMAYANKVNDDGSYLEGTASFAFNDNTGTRRILVGAVDRTASSAYDSTTFAVNVEAGWPQENDGTTITPTLGLAYSHLSADAYTETGAAGMNLNVTPSDYDTFEGKVGVKITGKSVDADGGIGRPEVRIGVTHNFGDDTADSTATFTAGGTSFTTTGVETDSTKVDLGLGYTYTTPEGDTDISVNIDGRSSSSYLQYGGGLTVKWKF